VRACAWPVWASVEVGDDWVSGVYMGRLSTRPSSAETVASWQSYVIFIVTDGKPADVLFQVRVLPNSRYPARTHSHSLIVYRMFG
jgi:hypothetical protein